MGHVCMLSAHRPQCLTGQALCCAPGVPGSRGHHPAPCPEAHSSAGRQEASKRLPIANGHFALEKLRPDQRRKALAWVWRAALGLGLEGVCLHRTGVSVSWRMGTLGCHVGVCSQQRVGVEAGGQRPECEGLGAR